MAFETQSKTHPTPPAPIRAGDPTEVHRPNPVPEVEEVKAEEVKVEKLKVKSVHVNNTIRVTRGGKDVEVSVPVNRVGPAKGDTVEVKFVGETATLVKPQPETAAKPKT